MISGFEIVAGTGKLYWVGKLLGAKFFNINEE